MSAIPDQVMQNAKDCQIVLCERPVNLGRHLDGIFYSQNLSHPFLVLVDEPHAAIEEIHAVPYDKTQAHGRSFLNRAFERSTLVTTILGLDSVVYELSQHSRYKDNFPTLHSKFCDCAKQYSHTDIRMPIINGTVEEIRPLWDSMKSTAESIDALELPYNRYGAGHDRYNCQTVIATILKKHGFGHQKLSGNFVAPGWRALSI